MPTVKTDDVHNFIRLLIGQYTQILKPTTQDRTECKCTILYVR